MWATSTQPFPEDAMRCRSGSGRKECAFAQSSLGTVSRWIIDCLRCSPHVLNAEGGDSGLGVWLVVEQNALVEERALFASHVLDNGVERRDQVVRDPSNIRFHTDLDERGM